MNETEVDRLVRLAGCEDLAVEKLENAIVELRAAREAQALLQQLPADELRRALASRRRALLRVVGS